MIGDASSPSWALVPGSGHKILDSGKDHGRVTDKLRNKSTQKLRNTDELRRTRRLAEDGIGSVLEK